MTKQGQEPGREQAEEQEPGQCTESSPERDDAQPSCTVGNDLARMVAELGVTVRAHLEGLGRR